MIDFLIAYTAILAVIFGLAGARLGWVLAIRQEMRRRVLQVVRRDLPPAVHPRLIVLEEMTRYRDRNN